MAEAPRKPQPSLPVLQSQFMKARAQLKLTCRRRSEVELAQQSLEQLRLLAHTLKSEYKWYSDLLFDLDGAIDGVGANDEMGEFINEYLGITDDYTQRLEVLTQLRLEAGDDAISSVPSVRPPKGCLRCVTHVQRRKTL